MYQSAVQKLPSDIIREVLKYFGTPMPLHKPQRFPWYLGQVCASWRRIFTSMTSQFWNRLDINLHVMNELHNDPDSLYAYYDHMLRLLQYFLDQARGQSLSFQFKTRFHCLEREDEYVGRMLELLVAESLRWEDVYVLFRISHLPILYRAKNRLPLLRSLQLIKRTYDKGPGDVYDLFEDTPRLKCLELGHLSDWRVSWSSLRILKIGEFSSDMKLLSILAQANRLEKLAIYESFDDVFNLQKITNLLSFPNLKVLTIIGFRLLSVLEAPSLEELYIEDFDEMNMSHTIVTSFLTRSSCRLKCLGMAGCSAVSLTDILRYAPDLVHLNLDNNNDMVKSFGQLAFHRQRRERVLPVRHLHSLTVMDPGLSDIEIMELSSLLTSRTKEAKNDSGDILVERLQRLLIITLDPLAPYRKRAAVESLRQHCIEQGVDFTVQSIKDIAWPHHDNTSILDW
ncbi:hypothetical protein AX15_006205 [Amanita polypyramis BW_CC]|nr:hypothetical protein AX15_006205 [Amanita polypyramis BW_CC]